MADVLPTCKEGPLPLQRGDPLRQVHPLEAPLVVIRVVGVQPRQQQELGQRACMVVVVVVVGEAGECSGPAGSMAQLAFRCGLCAAAHTQHLTCTSA